MWVEPRCGPPPDSFQSNEEGSSECNNLRQGRRLEREGTEPPGGQSPAGPLTQQQEEGKAGRASRKEEQDF